MASETNAERLAEVKKYLDEITDIRDSDKCGDIDKVTDTLFALLDNDHIYWLIEQSERAQELEQSTTVHVIKRRNGKATTIGWNGERYVYQSESTARGGHHNGKR